MTVLTNIQKKTGWNFRNSTESDLPLIEKLLTDADLPLDGVSDHLSNFLLAFNQDTLIGTAALETYGRAGLLRSVAVVEVERGTGLGQELVRQILDRARKERFEYIVLLTTTADRFFPRFGFKMVGREDVPAEVKESVEFKSACPASASVMQLDLKNPPLLVRLATQEDIPAITRIYNQGIEDLCTFETELRSVEERVEWFNNHDKQHPVIVAVKLGQVVGWASLNVFNARQVYRFVADLSIYIERDLRGSGIGSILLPALIERAKPLGFHKLVLATIPQTSSGIRLYQKFGFQHVGDYREQGLLNGRWTDTRIMELILE